MFKVIAQQGLARAGELHTAHGVVRTPAFMPIATRGTLKYVPTPVTQTLGNDILLANAYHLFTRPGLETLRAVGGLHTLMNWQKPILTDSGGFQVFSLANLRKITDDGVTIHSHLDGTEYFFTPELSMEIQEAIGSDIWMAFDYFPGYPAKLADAERSVALTTAWAKRCVAWKQAHAPESSSQLFGIIQGSSFPELRKQSAAELTALPFDGFAIGGLAVGEPPEIMYAMIEAAVPLLPENKPHYLMGVGQPEQILEAIKRGVDMFDCVLPTRNARHGQLYLHTQAELVDSNLTAVAYEKINITASRFQTDIEPLDPFCKCQVCTSGISRAYVRHLMQVGEPVAQYYTTIHNVSFYLELVSTIRQHLVQTPLL